MKTLLIEWKHLDVKGETCDRCYDTGENLFAEVKRLTRALEPKGITVELKEIKLDDTQSPQSNELFFNGISIEELLGLKVAENFCESCTSLLGQKTFCRSVEWEGTVYEEIPAKAIRLAAYKVIGLSEDTKPTKCGCGSGCCGN